MNKADKYFRDNILDIMINGVRDENPRPRYESDGEPAHSIYTTQVYEKYNIGKGEFPITTLRPITISGAIKEIFWIYKEQSNSLSLLEEKYKIMWWRPWEVGNTDTIGQRYGGTVKRHDLMNKTLENLTNDPYSRRHILSLWQEEDFKETEGLLPCAYQTLFSVREEGGVKYLDMTLIQRSSDYLVAGHINKMQYVAFMMMVAKHCSYQVGIFSHFVQNLHIYERHFKQAQILLDRTPSEKSPILKLNAPDGTNFYDINYEDFELVNYEPVKPQLKFELGI